MQQNRLKGKSEGIRSEGTTLDRPDAREPLSSLSPPGGGSQASLSGHDTLSQGEFDFYREIRTYGEVKFEFDQRVQTYGEELKRELVNNTPTDVWGTPHWKPHRIETDTIPAEYHERVAHYLLQAYKLPAAERHVAYNARFFKHIDLTVLARGLVARGDDGLIALGEHLHNFKGVDERMLFESLIKAPYPWVWLHNVDFFTTIPHLEIATEAIKAWGGGGGALYESVAKMKLSSSDEEAFIEVALQSNRPQDLAMVLHQFPTIGHAEALSRMFENHDREPYGILPVVMNVHRYPGRSVKKIVEFCESLVKGTALSKEGEPEWDARAISFVDASQGIGMAPFFYAVRSYLRDFSMLSNEEREKRLLQIDPVYVLKHIQDYPTLSQREVAMAVPFHGIYFASEISTSNEFVVWDDIAKLTKLTPQDKRELAEHIIADDCGYLVLENFKEFEGLDVLATIDKILDRDAGVNCFIRAGSFLGLSASEVFLRRLDRQIPSDSEMVWWIRHGGHGSEVAQVLLGSGFGWLVAEHKARFTGLSRNELSIAGLEAALRCIFKGKIVAAQKYVGDCAVDGASLNTRLAEQVEWDLAARDTSSEAILRRAGVAAWSLRHPEIRRVGVFAREPNILECYRKLLGGDRPDLLERDVSGKLVENLVAKGIPLLLRLKWLRDDTLGPLSDILPTFLTPSVGSEKAWEAHATNLGIDTKAILARERTYDDHINAARQILGPAATPRLIDEWVREAFSKSLTTPGWYGKEADKGALEDFSRPLNEDWRSEPLTNIFLDESVDPVVELQALKHFCDMFGIINDNHFYLFSYRGVRKADDSLPVLDDAQLATAAEWIKKVPDVNDWKLLEDASKRMSSPRDPSNSEPLQDDKLMDRAIDLVRRAAGGARPRLVLVAPPDDVKLLELLEMVHDERRRWCHHLTEESPVDPSHLSTDIIDFLTRWTRAQARGGESASASPDSEAFIDILSRFHQSWKAGRIRPRDACLTLQAINVNSSSHVTAGMGSWSNDIVLKFRSLLGNLDEIKDDDPRSLFERERYNVRNYLEEKRLRAKGWLAVNESGHSEPKRLESACVRLQHLERFLEAFNKANSPESLIELICLVKADDLKRTVVRLALSIGLDRCRDRDALLHALSAGPTEQSITRIVEFLANEVHDGALASLAKAPKGSSKAEALRVARNYLSYASFQNELRKHVRDAVRSTKAEAAVPLDQPRQEILVLPTRGVLGELAGFFSGACWTNKRDIIENHPNLTALIFAQRPQRLTDEELRGLSGFIDLSEAELLGACYILQVRDDKGDDVIVLRGINPREEEIRALDVESFIERLLDDVLVRYAKALGAKKVVAPFDDLGHAQTNRESISNYLSERYGKSEYVPLDLAGPNSQFNDRLIFDKCRLLREVQ